MACSECGRNGHKKPNCPIIEEKKEVQMERLITILQTIPLILSNPLFIAFAWFHFSKFNQAANTLNNIIAIAELVPTVDLSLPQGVVLGAMIEKSDDVVDYWNKMDFGTFIEEKGTWVAEGYEYWTDLARKTFVGILSPL